MKAKLSILIPLLALAACQTPVKPGEDKILVRAQQTYDEAHTTFNLIEKSEYESYAAFKAADAKTAGEVRTFVNKIRTNQKYWFRTALNLEEAYRKSSTAENATALNAALGTLTAAIAEANRYLTMMNITVPSSAH
jgi:hypothetical protein